MISGPTHAFDSTQVVEEPVTLIKTVEKKRDGLVISYSLDAETDTSVAVRIKDPLPPELTIEEKGFHPDHQPRNWGIEDDSLVFEDVIPADDTLYVVFGMVIERDIDDDVEMDFPEPTIEAHQPLDSDGENGRGGDEEVPLFRLSSLTEEGSSDLGTTEDTNAGGVVPGPEETDDRETTPPEEPAETSQESSSDHRWEFPDRDESPTDAGAMEEDETIIRETDSPEMESIETPESDDPSSAQLDSDESEKPILEESPAAEEDESAIVEPPETDQVPQEGVSGGADEQPSNVDSEAPTLKALLNEIQETDLSDQQRELLREELGIGPSRAMNVRLKHLESKMANFAAYSEAIEDLINEHGEASEFITSIENDLVELRTDLEHNQQRVEESQTERAELRSTLTEVTEQIETLDATVDDRVASVEDEIDGRITSIEEEVDERVQTVEADVDERIADLEDKIDERVRTVKDAVDQKLDAAEADLDERFDEFEDGFDDRVARIQTEVDAMDRYIEVRFGELEDEFDERVDGLQTEVDAIDRFLEERFSDLDDEIETLQTDLETVGDDLADKAETVEEDLDRIEERIGSLRETTTEDIDELREEVESVTEMRDVFAKAFGEVADRDIEGGLEAESDEDESATN